MKKVKEHWIQNMCIHYQNIQKTVATAAHGGGGFIVKSCPILCDPMDCSPPDSSVHGVLHTRILEWVAISFSRFLPYNNMNQL